METTEPDTSNDPADDQPNGDPQPDGDRQPMSPTTMALAAVGAVAVALLLVLVFTGGDGDGDGPGEAASELAALGFLTTDGSTSSLAAYQGDPLVVNFFASWCAPCRAELPDLERVHLARQDDIRFVGINHDLDETTWRSFVEETEITFETVFQPDTEIFTALDAKGMPTTVLLSADGEVLHLHTGLLTDDLLEELIDEHLGGA